jgi:decaprenylphospho-beta-D-ribofuranose 2-oxidase
MFQMISGWGNSIHSHTVLKKFENDLILSDVVNVRGAIPRGLGRSYGDSASNAGGITIESSNSSEIKIDVTNGKAVVPAGLTISELERSALRFGFFPHVVPGTGNVTIGGAIASDIHGKSHHYSGSFSNQVLEIEILTADGIKRIIHPSGNSSKLFWATVGGMGLTGLILQATIQLQKIECAYVTTKEVRAKNLETLLETLLDFNKSYFYTVAWIDISGKHTGRGIVSGANHSVMNELDKKQSRNRFVSSRIQTFRIRYPFKSSAVNRFTVHLFNFLWFFKPLNNRVQSIQRYMHPLDGIQNWNVLYGARGFVQYQFVVPFQEEKVLKIVIEKLKDSKCSSPLSVLKSFGSESKGLISFPMPGWTLAIDFPVGVPGLSVMLRELDELVVAAGGRVYLTKDSCLNPKHMKAMYPQLAEWKKVKRNIDPNNLWQSDQGRRLRLC